VRRVEALLRGHPDLLDGFNCFLPEVCARRIPPPTHHPHKTVAALHLSLPFAIVG